MPKRIKQIEAWLDEISEGRFTDIIPASSDASFRRYFRVTDKSDGSSHIIMDAPPDKEDCRPFIHVDELLIDAGISAPKILARDLERGFLLLSDLGSTPYLDKLDAHTVDSLYSDAIHTIVKMQGIEDHLPAYDETLLLDEMRLFDQWYIGRHLDISLDNDATDRLKKIYDLLIDNATAQPQVFVHRDFHSRNLMAIETNNPGVIDFQDAVIGPVTYDLVSLLKDCYIEWPRQKVLAWLQRYLSLTDRPLDLDQLTRWFDLMGVQRHLKVLGIFCRLSYRDGKSQYLNDLPLTLSYVLDACDLYHELLPLKEILSQHVLSHDKVRNG